MAQIALNLWNLIAILLVGFVAMKLGGVPRGVDKVISQILFSVALPALLFNSMINAHIQEIFSLTALTNVLAAMIIFVGFYVLAKYAFGLTDGSRTIVALVASYTNAGNLGVAYFAATTGQPEAAAPILLFQLCVMVPISFTLLDRQTGAVARSALRQVLSALSKPVVVATLLGLVVSVVRDAVGGFELPVVIADPISMIGRTSVPLMMLSLGMSFAAGRLPGFRREFLPLYSAVFGRVIIGPLLSFAIAMAFGLEGVELMTAVVAGCVPTANNVFVYAQRYDVGVEIARDAVAITVLVSMPIMLGAVWALHATGLA